MANLAQDLPAVWNAPTTTDAERKQLLRYAIAEVQLDGVTTPGKIAIRMTWQSGAVTERQSDRIKVGIWAPRTDDTVIERIRDWAPTHTVHEMVERLNREGLRSAHGRAFRDYHVLYIARRHQIPVTTCASRLPLAVNSYIPLSSLSRENIGNDGNSSGVFEYIYPNSASALQDFILLPKWLKRVNIIPLTSGYKSPRKSTLLGGSLVALVGRRGIT